VTESEPWNERDDIDATVKSMTQKNECKKKKRRKKNIKTSAALAHIS
jgi:hypothetical protein